jgi:hypothetical protein
VQALADTQQGAAFVALCADFRRDPHAVLDYIDDLDRADLAALTVTLGRWFSQLIHEKADSVTTEEQASQQVIAEARTFASEYALGLHAAQAEEERAVSETWICQRGHEVDCQQCGQIEYEAGVLDRDRALAHRPGAVFAVMFGQCLHAAGCHVVVHPDSVTVDEKMHGHTYAKFMTRPEAQAWLDAGRAHRDRRRCSICAPDIPESPETKAGGWSHHAAQP